MLGQVAAAAKPGSAGRGYSVRNVAIPVAVPPYNCYSRGMNTNTLTIAQTILEDLNVEHTVNAKGWAGTIHTGLGFALWTSDSASDINVVYGDAGRYQYQTGTVRISGTPEIIEAMLSAVLGSSVA